MEDMVIFSAEAGTWIENEPSFPEVVPWVVPGI
jgi:hypothetical protein